MLYGPIAVKNDRLRRENERNDKAKAEEAERYMATLEEGKRKGLLTAPQAREMFRRYLEAGQPQPPQLMLPPPER